jgi:hypothetical protein
MRAEAETKQTNEQIREAAREQQAGKSMDVVQETDTEAILARQKGHYTMDDDLSL